MIAEPLQRSGNQDVPPGEAHIGSKPSTDRVRLHRERRRLGLTPLIIEVYDQEVDDLVDHGLLAADQRGDRGAVAQAIGQILDRAFRLLRGGWLPKG